MRQQNLASLIKEMTMRVNGVLMAVGAAGILGIVSMMTRAEEPAEKSFSVRPIGTVQKQGDRTVIVIDKAYQDGLLGLEQWSHAQILWWFDRNDTPQQRSILRVHPRGDQNNPLTGVFACRAPVRPNLIALSLCRVISVEDNVIEVESIDALEGTPVLDIKPYSPGHDAASEVRVPEWARPK